MAGDDNMDIEVAERQLKALDHSEQHYFNRQVCRASRPRMAMLVLTPLRPALQLQPPW